MAVIAVTVLPLQTISKADRLTPQVITPVQLPPDRIGKLFNQSLSVIPQLLFAAIGVPDPGELPETVVAVMCCMVFSIDDRQQMAIDIIFVAGQFTRAVGVLRQLPVPFPAKVCLRPYGIGYAFRKG
ncbi:Uncharacterised protein [Yersinia pseudotuberculosis]|nr:Uncharacterised protein [Yersinia pseudotuberculosis]